MKLERLDHFVLTVKDMEASRWDRSNRFTFATRMITLSRFRVIFEKTGSATPARRRSPPYLYAALAAFMNSSSVLHQPFMRNIRQLDMIGIDKCGRGREAAWAAVLPDRFCSKGGTFHGFVDFRFVRSDGGFGAPQAVPRLI
jgi:hypothetical protein